VEYDLVMLSEALKIERDELIQYTGIQTLYERYFIKLNEGDRLELLQGFWMRVTMALVLSSFISKFSSHAATHALHAIHSSVTTILCFAITTSHLYTL